MKNVSYCREEKKGKEKDTSSSFDSFPFFSLPIMKRGGRGKVGGRKGSGGKKEPSGSSCLDVHPIVFLFFFVSKALFFFFCFFSRVVFVCIFIQTKKNSK